MAYITTYSFADVSVVLNGAEVDFLWEGDDAVEIEDMDDFAEAMQGVDGKIIHSMNAGDAKRITIRLMHTSPAHRFLNDRARLMRAGTDARFPISVRDTRSGEGGNSPECIIITRPGRSYGRTASEREWVMIAAPWTDYEITYNALA